MSVFIRNLRCKVRVRTGRKASVLHQTESPLRPALAFVMPVDGAQKRIEAGSRTTPHNEEPLDNLDNTAPRANAASADTRAVADRVYELMREETRMGRLRSGRN